MKKNPSTSQAHAIVLMLLTCNSACVHFNWTLKTAQSFARSIWHMCHSDLTAKRCQIDAIQLRCDLSTQGQLRHSTTLQSAESTITYNTTLLKYYRQILSQTYVNLQKSADDFHIFRHKGTDSVLNRAMFEVPVGVWMIVTQTWIFGSVICASCSGKNTPATNIKSVRLVSKL